MQSRESRGLKPSMGGGSAPAVSAGEQEGQLAGAGQLWSQPIDYPAASPQGGGGPRTWLAFIGTARCAPSTARWLE